MILAGTDSAGGHDGVLRSKRQRRAAISAWPNGLGHQVTGDMRLKARSMNRMSLAEN